MRLKALFAYAAILSTHLVTHLSTSTALAVDVCMLAQQPVLAVEHYGAEAIQTYKQKLASECALSEKYQQMKLKARDKYGMTLEQITLYQAMRFVSRQDYRNAEMTRTSLALENFAGLNNALELERARLNSGAGLTLVDLQRFNTYFPSSTPGQLKPPSEIDVEWRKLAPAEVTTAQSTASDVNDEYTNLGFLEGGLESLYDRTYVNEIVRVKKSADGYTDALYGGDTRATEKHLGEILKFVNDMLAQSRQGHMVWHEQLMTPGEVAYLTQKFINDVHPFFEKNEQTSRFVQELILTSFSLPHGDSGDLMEQDVFVSRANYYANAMTANQNLLVSVDQCLETFYNRERETPRVSAPRRSSKDEGSAPPPPPPVPQVDYSHLEYGCRVLR